MLSEIGGPGHARNAVKQSSGGHVFAAMRRNADLMRMTDHIFQSRVAIFIDGDNIAPKFFLSILEQAGRFGCIDVVRVYADSSHVDPWRETPGIMLAPVATSKNASDIALSIDAMETAIDTDISTFVIASADQGFAHLAQRLRARGKKVVGASGADPSEFFKNSCSEFCTLSVTFTSKQTDELQSKILGVLGQKPTQPLPISEFGSKMQKLGVTKADLPSATWRAYLAQQPDRYIVDNQSVQLRVDRVA